MISFKTRVSAAYVEAVATLKDLMSAASAIPSTHDLLAILRRKDESVTVRRVVKACAGLGLRLVNV